MGIIVDIFLPMALAFIMFSLGLGLTGKDFTRIIRQPKDFMIGLTSQILILPVVAFSLLMIFPTHPEIALGVMIIAAAPGGATSNILTAFARGDVALSISLTAVTSLLCVFTIPLIVTFSYTHFIGADLTHDISILGIALSVFAIVTIPVLVGLGVRKFATSFALKTKPIARRLSIIFFIIVLSAAIFQERHNIAEYFSQAGAITLTLNIAMMSIAFLLAYVFAMGTAQRSAISIECGLQNGTLAIAVAMLMFDGGLVSVPAATYSLLMFATGLVFVAVFRKMNQT